MTQIMDDETLQIFLDEAKEHLETIEGDLLTIEEQGDQFDEEIVNKVFRAAHSLKGGAGFLGLTTIKELAHKLESVLQMVRSFELKPTSDIIGRVLAGFDRLSILLNDPQRSNDMDISEQVKALEAIITASLPAEEKDSLQKTTSIADNSRKCTFELKQFDMNQALKGGKTLYILTFDLIKDIQRRGKTPLELLNTLQDSGLILDSKSDISGIGDLDSEVLVSSFPLLVLFASIVEPDLIGVLLNLPPEQIFVVPAAAIAEAATPAAVAIPEKQGAYSDPEPEAEPVETKETTVSPSPAASKKSSVAVPQTAGASSPKTEKSKASESLRVNVQVLDQLMNRAGELVLSRNQLMQAITSNEKQNIAIAGSRIDIVTSELHEAIMLTRMQQLGIIFNKFPRVVRDLSNELNKIIELEMIGKEVELDKTLIESLGDPLTHLVRNSLDHGIEMSEVRKKLGKQAKVTIIPKPSYETGQVVIEIQDDGKGLDGDMIARKAVEKGLYTAEEVAGMSEKDKYNLIMLPGFSTAEKVTDISGRGVGMDVVKTNLEKIGGQIDIISEINKGTTIRIKLPLTLAIMPSLLVSSCNERFALPQVNVSELIRIPASEIQQKIEKIGGADVFILRNELIPLLQLNNILDLQRTFYDFKTGTFKPDRRQGVVDERLYPEADGSEAPPVGGDITGRGIGTTGNARERRFSKQNDAVIVVINEGSFRYGLLVDAVHDTVEIVVKPLGSFLGNLPIYAGATIMGDGHLALILDVVGIARKAELRSMSDLKPEKEKDEQQQRREGLTRQTLLIFHNGPDEFCAVPLHQVLRVEQILASAIELRAGTKVIQYRGGHLPVYALEEVANVDVLEEREKLIVIIFVVEGREVGLLAVQPLDVIEADLAVDEYTLSQTGISGSTIIKGHTTLLVDIYGMMRSIHPQWFIEKEPARAKEPDRVPEATVSTGAPSVLLVEDSEFFRSQVKQFIAEDGYQVIEAADGQIAWDFLESNQQSVQLVVTDIEMPNMDGFELSQRIKTGERTSHLPIIALTSLASDEDRQKGKEIGIDDYQIKMDKNKLQESIRNFLQNA